MLKSFAALLEVFEHSLKMPPSSVLCEGTHPITGILNTPILLPPSPYSFYDIMIEENDV